MGRPLSDTTPPDKHVFLAYYRHSTSTALDFSTIKSYFDNLGELLREHKYPPTAIYNVDETGFSIGSSRKSVVLLDQLDKRRETKQPGRQEWITSLECVNAAGVTLPPCLIFKGENLNSG
jgi:hypothetical protein